MKKTNLLLLPVLVLILLSFNIPQNNETSLGALGDVKYSILPPDQFRKLNGSGWVLLDGRNIQQTDLYNFLQDETMLGILRDDKRIPNANGMFLRAMGYQRGLSDDNRDRKIGSFQNYGTKLPKDSKFQGKGKGKTTVNGEHSHDTTLGWGGGPHNTGKIRTSSNSPKNMWGGEIKKAGKHSHNVTVEEVTIYKGGDKETRPKNLAFYLYMKVKN